VLPTQQIPDAVGFLERAVTRFAAHGVLAERVMTDNGSAYRSHAFQATCAHLALRHLSTRPHTLRTNGKAERFIQTLLRESAYHRSYAHLAAPGACTAAVAALLQRPPTAHELELPCSYDSASAGLAMNNLPGFNT